MTTIVAGSDAQFSVTLLNNGDPVPVSGATKALVCTLDGKTTLVPETDLSENATGADWPSGVVAVQIAGAATAAIAPGNYMLVLTGSFGAKRFSLTVETLFVPVQTSLFVKDLIIDEIRRDRIMAAAASILTGIKISDDYIWNKVRAAESEISHTLRVPLVPTQFFPLKPTQDQIDALNGMAWDVDPAYDYTPDMFHFEKWGYIVSRQRPIISVDQMRFAYPSANTGFFDIPISWIRTDARFGHIRLVPDSPGMVFTNMNAFIMTALTGARSVPFMIQITYKAGLEDVQTKYPELLDVIKKFAVLKIVQDSWLPQSGSISADGLSQSISVDMDKYQDVIDHTLYGPKDSNGGLMTKLHGVRMMVV